MKSFAIDKKQLRSCVDVIYSVCYDKIMVNGMCLIILSVTIIIIFKMALL